MSLDVTPPDPPKLQSVDPNQYEDASVESDEYHREDLQRFLREGAWVEAFEQWAATASIGEAEWRIVEELDLVDRFDFFWDDFADRVGYHAPGIPETWKEREVHPDLKNWGQVSGINAGLTELGQVVCEVLKENYIDWESSFEAPDDLPDFG